MGRKPSDSLPTRWASSLFLLLTGLVFCTFLFIFASVPTKPTKIYWNSESASVEMDGGCCGGIEKLELWGAAVKWGSEFKLNSSEDCCEACKAMCIGNDGSCLCDTWVFCGDREACGSHFGECWLKKQKDTLAPERKEVGNKVGWTSGLIFGKGEGIVGLETEYGTLHIKVNAHVFGNMCSVQLLPDCAPYSVAYILELLDLRHCTGCEFYRAESRGQIWDLEGNHIKDATFGPPFAMIQGTLEALGTPFRTIPTEVCPSIWRGSVGWVGSGPEFFISLANHQEWKKSHTVFGYVLPEDMEIAEKISQFPTKLVVYNHMDVSVLEKPIPLRIQRVKTNHGKVRI
ncbi:hypothetical protein U1Q18_021453 [Sarracenia purpurea var. burkii]